MKKPKNSGTAEDMGAMLLDRATVVPVPLETLKRWAKASESMIGAYVRHRRRYGWFGDEADVESCRRLRATVKELCALIEEPRS